MGVVEQKSKDEHCAYVVAGEMGGFRSLRLQ